jgi:hypothetical protein
LTSPTKLKIFSEAARKRAVEFDSGRIVTLYEQYYERILSSR